MNDHELKIDNLPNRLTIFRIALVPVVVACLFFEKNQWFQHLDLIAAGIFVLASITDFMDGYIARKRGLVTVFGSFLDPIADKFLVVSALVMLLALDRVSVLVVIVLVMREFYMTSLRLLAFREGVDVSALATGKWKTAMQLIGIPLLMVKGVWWGVSTIFVGTIFIYAATLLSLYSALFYSVGLVKKLRHKRRMTKQDKDKGKDKDKVLQPPFLRQY